MVFSIKLTKWSHSQLWGPRENKRSRRVLFYSWPSNSVGFIEAKPCTVRNPCVTFDFSKTWLLIASCWLEALLITYIVNEHLFCVPGVLYSIFLQSSKIDATLLKSEGRENTYCTVLIEKTVWKWTSAVQIPVVRGQTVLLKPPFQNPSSSSK